MGIVTSMMGLSAWTGQLDPYNYIQLANNWNIVDFHDHSPGRGVQIGSAGISPGAILPQHLTSSLLQDLGLNGGSNTGRGNFIKSAADTTGSTSYVSLGDQVSNLVLATNGVIRISYRALWSCAGGGTATAGLFLTPSGGSATQVVNGTSATSATVSVTSTAAFLSPLYSAGNTLGTAAAASNQSDFTTGVTLGGFTLIYAAAGTYTVGIQFQITTGTLTVQNRHLWASAENYV